MASCDQIHRRWLEINPLLRFLVIMETLYNNNINLYIRVHHRVRIYRNLRVMCNILYIPLL